jgi:hypothetical protein
MTNWPTQKECDSFYGNPRGRNGQPSLKWERENLVPVVSPFQMFYAGKPIKSFRMHKKCAAATLKALQAIDAATKGDKSLLAESGASVFGGSYNFRLMRNGTRLSMHSWGCAIDLDPVRNGLGDATPHFAKHPFIAKAFEDQGATWGGRWSGSGCDGMHFQFADVF